MSAEHRKPVVAFVLLALVTVALVGLQRADAQHGRFLAAALGAGAAVSGSVPAPDLADKADARERVEALGPAFAALSGDADTVTIIDTPVPVATRATDSTTAAPTASSSTQAAPARTSTQTRPVRTATKTVRQAATGAVQPVRKSEKATKAGATATKAARKAEKAAKKAARQTAAKAARALTRDARPGRARAGHDGKRVRGERRHGWFAAMFRRVVEDVDHRGARFLGRHDRSDHDRGYHRRDRSDHRRDRADRDDRDRDDRADRDRGRDRDGWRSHRGWGSKHGRGYGRGRH